VVERPTFLEVPRILEANGVRVTTAAWEELAHTVGDAVWVTAPARNPDGRQLDPGLLATLAGTYRTVVCNTAYEWFDDLPALPDGVVRAGTLHKVAGPGAQLGWAAGPDWDRTTLQRFWITAPPLHWQRAWGYFLGAGGMSALRERHADLAGTREAVQAGLGLPVAGAGPHVLVPVAGKEEEAVAAIADAGVLVSPGSAFAATEPSIRVCLFGVSAAEAARAASVIRTVLPGFPAAAGVPATRG
jgi:DNA-binding transcriptional MocR family regulator